MPAAARVPEGRAVTIPLMGKQPVLVAGTVSRPEMQPAVEQNLFDPIISERPRLAKPSYDSTVPRPVEEADLVEFFDWGLGRFLKIFPRATEATVRPWLMHCLHAPGHRFVRTSICFGLFYAERTPWEPELAVYDHFVVARAPSTAKTDVDRVMNRAQSLEAPNVYKEGHRWFKEINAVSFQFGQTTGVDLEPIAKMLGFDLAKGDRHASGYTIVQRLE